MAQISYDGTFKELLDGFHNNDIVGTINRLFDEEHPKNSEVKKLATESHDNNKEMRSDKILQIGDDTYHIELQTDDDKSIVTRVFIYSYRAAMQHSKQDGVDFLELRFPKTVVFYLRSDENTPRELTVRLTLPDGNKVSYKVPTKRLCEYTPEDLTEKSMLIFAPFYSMLWENKLKTPETLEELQNVMLFLSDGIKKQLENGEVSKITADYATNALRVILRNVLTKSKVKPEEVTNLMEAVEKRYNLDINNWRAEGKTEGAIEFAKKLLGMGDSVDKVVTVTGLPREKVESLHPQ